MFFKVYFIDYAITVVPIFPPFPPLPSTALPSSSTYPYCSCPWVMHVSSLASPFSILFLTPPCLFCTYQLCFLNPASCLLVLCAISSDLKLSGTWAHIKYYWMSGYYWDFCHSLHPSKNLTSIFICFPHSAQLQICPSWHLQLLNNGHHLGISMQSANSRAHFWFEFFWPLWIVFLWLLVIKTNNQKDSLFSLIAKLDIAQFKIKCTHTHKTSQTGYYNYIKFFVSISSVGLSCLAYTSK